MSIVAFIRHGEYGLDGGLTNVGFWNIQYLSRSLVKRFGSIYPHRITILSSTAKRATESAELIAKALSVGSVRQYECLEVNGEDIPKEKSEELTRIINELLPNVDLLLCVTHAPVCWYFVFDFARNSEIYGTGFGTEMPRYGECRWLDLKEKSSGFVV